MLLPLQRMLQRCCISDVRKMSEEEGMNTLSPVMVLLIWEAELHHNCALTPTPQREKGRRNYVGKKRKKKKGSLVEIRII